MTQPFALAACAEMLWPEQPMEWRVRRLTELGFGVGLWNWPDLDLDALERSGAAFTIMNGYLQGRLRRRRFQRRRWRRSAKRSRSEAAGPSIR